jgi:hypothetical protein
MISKDIFKDLICISTDYQMSTIEDYIKEMLYDEEIGDKLISSCNKFHLVLECIALQQYISEILDSIMYQVCEIQSSQMKWLRLAIKVTQCQDQGSKAMFIGALMLMAVVRQIFYNEDFSEHIAVITKASEVLKQIKNDIGGE